MHAPTKPLVLVRKYLPLSQFNSSTGRNHTRLAEAKKASFVILSQARTSLEIQIPLVG